MIGSSAAGSSQLLEENQISGELKELPTTKLGTLQIQGQSMICLPTSENKNQFYLYICGGRTHSQKNSGQRNILSDIVKVKLDNNSKIFTRLPLEKNTSLDCPRHNHTSIYFKSIESVVTFGGSNTNTYLNSIFVMDVNDETEVKSINPPNLKSIWPTSRHGHSASIYKEDFMVVFGGKSGFGIEPSAFINDIWIYNVKTNTWQEIETSTINRPQPRCWHSSVLYGNRFLLVSGGFYTSDGVECYLNDLWSLDLETNEWNCLIENDDITNRNQMHPRNRCGMVLTENAVFVMFGNYFDGSRDHFLSDIFYLNNLDDLLLNGKEKISNHSITWKTLQVKSVNAGSTKFISEGRGHISTSLLKENRNLIEILLFGGESFKKRHDNFLLLTIYK